MSIVRFKRIYAVFISTLIFVGCRTVSESYESDSMNASTANDMVSVIDRTVSGKRPFRLSATDRQTMNTVTCQICSIHKERQRKLNNEIEASAKLKRTYHYTSNGCLRGELKVKASSPQGAVGIFSDPNKTYPVYARYTNIAEFNDNNRDLRGLGIKVLNLEHPSRLLEQDPNYRSQDFLANDTQLHFARGPLEIMQFNHDLTYNQNRERHLAMMMTAASTLDMPESLVQKEFHSRAPFALGSKSSIIRYYLKPCEAERIRCKDHGSIGNGILSTVGTSLSRPRLSAVQRQKFPVKKSRV